MTQTAQPTDAAPANTTLNFAAITEHPTRLRCWSLLAERTMSPKEIADETGLRLSDVAYHVRKLRDLKVIELVREEPRRGAKEHWYRCVARPDMRLPDVATLTLDESQAHAAHIVQLQMADVSAAMEGETMVERPDHSVIRFPLPTDEQGFGEISNLLDDTLDRIYEIQQAMIRRTEKEPEKRDISTSVHLNFFEMPRRQAPVTENALEE